MKRSIALILAILFAGPLLAAAQVIPVYGILYRPPGLQYDVLRSEHFNIIFERGAERDAADLAEILESALPDAADLLPVRSKFRMPVVLNGFNDRGNGFVSPIPFRQEIEAVAFRGRALSPRHASWFATVGPHELVHAVHADYRAGFGTGWLLGLFAPDIARAFNLWVPPGMAEGAAVWLESRQGGRSGRLNAPYFTAPFRASLAKGRGWSLARTLEFPSYSRSSDRYYVGGSMFFDWLVRTHGPDAFRRVTSIHNRFPFLGYGFSMWLGTGSAPWSTGRAFRKDAARREKTRLEIQGPFTETETIDGGKGVVLRRPRWLDNESIIAWRSGYNRRRGLYRINVETGRPSVIAHEQLSDDLQFGLDADGGQIVYSRFLSDPFAGVKKVSDVFELDVATGSRSRLSHGARIFTPVRKADGAIWATRPAGSGTEWVVLDGDRDVTVLGEWTDSRVRTIEPFHGDGRMAVIVNRMGVQEVRIGILVAGEQSSAGWIVRVPTGSVHDVAWSPDGAWIVISADPDDALDLFAIHLASGSVRRLTRLKTAGIEPSISPDGSRIAFIELGEDRFDLVVLPFDPDQAEKVPAGLIDVIREGVMVDAISIAGEAATSNPTGTEMADRSTIQPYRASSYLRPRLFYPVVYAADSWRGGEGLGTGFGLAMQGADPLKRWAYWGEGIVRGGRLWGEFGVASSISVLRPIVRVYDRPEALTLRFAQASEPQRVVRRERGIEGAVRLPVILNDNVYQSTLSLGLGARYAGEREYSTDLDVLTSWRRRLTILPAATLAIGVQRNLRDLVPNSGLIIGAGSEIDLHTEGGAISRGLVVGANLYLPVLSRWNVGLRFGASLLTQNRPGVYDLDYFMPRGHQYSDLRRGWGIRYGAEAVVPVLYVDDGLFILPIYLSSVYLFGFAEQLYEPGYESDRLTAIGGGLAVQMRLFYVLNFELRFGYARRPGIGDWRPVYR